MNFYIGKFSFMRPPKEGEITGEYLNWDEITAEEQERFVERIYHDNDALRNEVNFLREALLTLSSQSRSNYEDRR